MKIKYSKKIKEILLESTLQEIVQLSFSFIPYQSLHIFSFEHIDYNEICITHQIPRANIERKIYLSNREIPDEIIVLFRTQDTIYIFADSEYIK